MVSRLTLAKGHGCLLGECSTGSSRPAGALRCWAPATRRWRPCSAPPPRAIPVGSASSLGFDERLSHLIQGGADAILVPSRFEPCGLTQFYGLRYGCVPVVARVGGLADTIIDANEAALAAGVATGVQFLPVDRGGLESAIARAIALHRDRATWTQLQKRGMKTDVSWSTSAKRYAALYRDMLQRKTS